MNQDLSEQELRKRIQTQVFDQVADRVVSNPSLEVAILINRKGLKHCISRRYPNTHQRILALPHLPMLLTQADYLGREPDNHIPPRPGIFIHKFETTHDIDGTTYKVWLYVRETPDLVNFYDLGVVDIST